MTTPAAQWPQQQQVQPSQAYSYPGYQQQYAQQQYPPQQYAGQQYAQQQYPPQQYATSPPAAYQQSYQPTPTANPSQGQQVAPQTSHTCYNCGSPEHWAQNCPEPRREVPAGLMNEQNYHRPPKRQKTNAPIITKYPLPPHVAPPQGPPRAYGTTSYGQPGYHQPHGVPGPPTPLSARSSAPPQWQQSSQYQQYQQHYQQGYPYQQGSSYQQQPYTAATPLTPNTYYGPQNPGQPSTQWPQYNAAYNQQNAQHQQTSGVPAQPYSAASPSSAISLATGYSWNQYQGATGSDSVATFQGSPATNAPVHSQSSTPKPPSAHGTDSDTEEDDLDKLDVPDIPSGGALIDLTGRPLSANFVVAEAIPLLPPEPDNDGCCRSKYTDRGKPDILGQNIKDTSYWEEFSRDPIFSPIGDDGVVVPIDYLKSLYDPGQAYQGRSQEPEHNDNNSLQESRFQLDGEDVGDVMDSLEHALNVGRPKPLQLSSSKSAVAVDQASAPNPGSRIPSARDTEAMLAALGVTGAPKPVRAPARPYPPPSTQELSLQASPNGTSRSRSRSPIIYDSNGMSQWRHMSNSGAESQSREKNSDPLQRGSYNSRYSTINHEQLPAGSAERSDSQNIEPPPPPPPPLRKPSFYDGNIGSPFSTGSSHEASNGYGNPNSDNGNAHQNYLIDAQSASPVKLRAGGPNGRKRDFDNRDDSSDEGETQGRRQVDDVTPKLKRRQPKVAEAYSRRW